MAQITVVDIRITLFEHSFKTKTFSKIIRKKSKSNSYKEIIKFPQLFHPELYLILSFPIIFYVILCNVKEKLFNQ